MSDSFVFYRSFYETAQMIGNESDRLTLYEALIVYGLTGEKPALEYPLNAILEQMTASVKAASDRYTAAKESGEKGGRPKKWIPPEEWQAYYKEHGRKATAEHYGIPEETIKKWVSSMGKKGKNLNYNINVNDNDNLNVNDNSNYNYQNNINNKEESQKTLKGVSAPLQPRQDVPPCSPGYEFVNKGILYRFNDKCEVVRVGAV